MANASNNTITFTGNSVINNAAALYGITMTDCTNNTIRGITVNGLNVADAVGIFVTGGSGNTLGTAPIGSAITITNIVVLRSFALFCKGTDSNNFGVNISCLSGAITGVGLINSNSNTISGMWGAGTQLQSSTITPFGTTPIYGITMTNCSLNTFQGITIHGRAYINGIYMEGCFTNTFGTNTSPDTIPRNGALTLTNISLPGAGYMSMNIRNSSDNNFNVRHDHYATGITGVGMINAHSNAITFLSRAGASDSYVHMPDNPTFARGLSMTDCTKNIIKGLRIVNIQGADSVGLYLTNCFTNTFGVEPAATAITISSISGLRSYSMFLDNSSDNNFAVNIAAEAATTGVGMANSHNNTIIGSTGNGIVGAVINTGNIGFTMTNCNLNTISRITISGQTSCGLFMDNCMSNTFGVDNLTNRITLTSITTAGSYSMYWRNSSGNKGNLTLGVSIDVLTGTGFINCHNNALTFAGTSFLGHSAGNGYGITMTNCSNNVMTGSTVNLVYGRVSALYLYNCYNNQLGSLGINTGVTPDAGYGLKLISCTGNALTFTATSYINGSTTHSGGITMTDCANNTISTTSGVTVRISVQTTVTSIYLANCNNNNFTGVYPTDGRGVWLLNSNWNAFTATGVGGIATDTGGYGISMTNCANNTFTATGNNTITMTGQTIYSYYLDNCNNNTFVGWNITSGAGLRLLNSQSNVMSFTGASTTSLGLHGLTMTDCTLNRISGIQFSGSTQYGMYMYNCTTNTLGGLTDASRITVTGITAANTYAMYLQNCSNNVMTMTLGAASNSTTGTGFVNCNNNTLTFAGSNCLGYSIGNYGITMTDCSNNVFTGTQLNIVYSPAWAISLNNCYDNQFHNLGINSGVYLAANTASGGRGIEIISSTGNALTFVATSYINYGTIGLFMRDSAYNIITTTGTAVVPQMNANPGVTLTACYLANCNNNTLVNFLPAASRGVWMLNCSTNTWTAAGGNYTLTLNTGGYGISMTNCANNAFTATGTNFMQVSAQATAGFYLDTCQDNWFYGWYPTSGAGIWMLNSGNNALTFTGGAGITAGVAGISMTNCANNSISGTGTNSLNIAIGGAVTAVYLTNCTSNTFWACNINTGNAVNAGPPLWMISCTGNAYTFTATSYINSNSCTVGLSMTDCAYNIITTTSTAVLPQFNANSGLTVRGAYLVNCNNNTLVNMLPAGGRGIWMLNCSTNTWTSTAGFTLTLDGGYGVSMTNCANNTFTATGTNFMQVSGQTSAGFYLSSCQNNQFYGWYPTGGAGIGFLNSNNNGMTFTATGAINAVGLWGVGISMTNCANNTISSTP
ncbi:MAG: hypothetical protein QME51_05810, partial [Planctomycetota bacterium]|nr:hypothetical protein [Planctomycetota bacterium]